MANAYKLYDICKQCGGTGIGSSTTNNVCKSCDGKKVALVGYCSEAVFDIPELDEE